MDATYQAHSQKLSCNFLAPGGPRSPGPALPQHRHTHVHLPHVHSKHSQKLLGTHSESGAWKWFPAL